MLIYIDTQKDGEHKRWEFSEESFEDQLLFDHDFSDLENYLNDCDIGIDSGGPFATQTKDALLSLFDSDGGYTSLVLADSEHWDMTVDITVEKE